MSLLDDLAHDEGCVLRVYPDSLGILTAGYGHNCEAHNEGLKEGDPITQEQADLWKLQDAARASAELDEHFPWAKQLDQPRHDVLVNMLFNMGLGDDKRGFSSFHHFLALCQLQDYAGAAQAMLDSLWAKQVGKNPPDAKHPYGGRAWRLAHQLETGEPSPIKPR